MASRSSDIIKQLLAEKEELLARLTVAEDTLHAIQNGEVDAIVVFGDEGEKIFSLNSAETPYRIIVEEMNEGTVAVSAEGTILYCNQRFAELVATPLEKIIGSDFNRFVSEADHQKYRLLLQTGLKERCQGEISCFIPGSSLVYFHLAFNPLPPEMIGDVCIVVTEITYLKQREAELLLARVTLEQQIIERTSSLTRTLDKLVLARIAAVNMMEDAVEAKKQVENANLALIQEIVEHNLAEQSLLKSEERYRSLLTHLEAGVVVHAPDTSIIMNNHRASELLGLSDDQMRGKLAIDPNWKFIDEKNVPLLPEDYPVNRILATKEPFSNVIIGVIRPADNDIVWLTVNGFPVLNSHGDISEILISFIDITERRKAEEALRDSEAKFRNLVWDMQVGVLLQGPEAEIILSNPKSLELLGVTEDQLLGKTSFDPGWNVIHEDGSSFPGSDHPVPQAIATRQPVRDVVMGVYRPSKNDRVWLLVDAEPQLNEIGVVQQIVCTFVDITLRKLSEEVLAESEKRYRSLFDNMLNGYAYCKMLYNDDKPDDFIYIDVNKSFESLTGLKNVNGKKVSEVIPGIREADNNLFEIFSRVALTGIPETFEMLVISLGDWYAITVYSPQKEYFIAVFDVITERKRAEIALVQNRNLLANLAQLVPGVVYQYRLYPDGRSAFPYASPGMNDIYEVTPEEVLEDATPVFGRLHPDDFDHVVDAIQESARTLNTFYCEYRVRLPRQGQRWRWSQAQPVRLEDGSILWHGIISDITERKLKEVALIESERKFRETVANLDEGYYSVTIDGVLLEHNQSFCRILGFDKTSDLTGIHLPDFWQQPDEKSKYLDTILTNGFVSNYQINVKSRTGEKGTVLANAHIVKDEDSHPLRIEGVFLDITDRIRTEDALHRHAERLQNLHKIDKAILSPVETPEAIIQKALQHIRSLLSSQYASIGIFDFENEALQIFAANIKDGSIDKSEKFMIDKAYGDLEVLRQNRMAVVEDISTKSSPPELLKVLQSEGIMSCINVPLVSGEKLIGAMNLGWGDPRAFTPEELEIASEVADEITIAIEQVRLRQVAKQYTEEMEKMVEERTSQLLAANKELEAFSYSVSHDLRAPLRHINGYISILSKHLQNTLSEKEKHYLDTIADSAHQMGVLIDDLLHFSRTGRQEMQLTSLDMNAVLKDALQVIQHESFGRGIKWVVAGLPRVSGDYALLRLVWLNLLSNAVKFCRVNVISQIEVGFFDEINEFVFFVRDNGVGFDMQYAHKLFGVFERLHSAQEFEGTGIGLANVRRIIQRHGGRTWAEAEVGKGATFYFSLPK